MPFRSAFSSIKLLKISLASGGTTIILGWIDFLSGTASLLKDMATIGTASVAIWGAAAFFKLEVKKIIDNQKSKNKPKT